MNWVRLWTDMPTDPKWRVIARRSGSRIPDVIAVFNLMLVCAGQAVDRGTLEGWDDEDAAACLDLDPETVTAIREAMRGKVLDGERLSGWEKRQPKREDDSRERVTRYRERMRNERNASVTHGNAPDTETDTEKKVEGANAPLSVPAEPTHSSGSSKRTKRGYSEDFERFWSEYPTDPNMSKKEAHDVWKRLPDEERKAAIAALPAFRAYCRDNPTYRPIHACRFLSKKRADGFLAAPSAKTDPDEKRRWRDRWASAGVDRDVPADPQRQADWPDLLAYWFTTGRWLANGPSPDHPQCPIPLPFVEAYRRDKGWIAPKIRAGPDDEEDEEPRRAANG